MIEIENLTKYYGKKLAVDNISFKVKKGAIVGFLGRNGAGKSTTMNMITGYISASGGTARINGYDILKQPREAKRSIGYLPEHPPVYQEMTVNEYLKFVCAIKDVKASSVESHIEEIASLVKLNEVMDRRIGNLSKGYQQRVGMGQALVGNPEVLILDEPTVGLDPKQIIEIRDLIKSLKKKHTVILSSHILSEVSAVCDYVLIISHGKLVASDTPENLGKLAEGSNTLNLLVKGDKDHIRIALGQIDGVKDITVASAKEEHAWNVTLSTKEDMDIREEVFFRMADAHCPILEMKSKKVSLEEIFLELTEDDKKKKNEKETDKKEGENK